MVMPAFNSSNIKITLILYCESLFNCIIWCGKYSAVWRRRVTRRGSKIEGLIPPRNLFTCAENCWTSTLNYWSRSKVFIKYILAGAAERRIKVKFSFFFMLFFFVEITVQRTNACLSLLYSRKAISKSLPARNKMLFDFSYLLQPVWNVRHSALQACRRSHFTILIDSHRFCWA